MELFFTMVIPLTIAGVALYGLGRGVDVYDALAQGAGGGLEVLLRIFPALVGLMTAVSMLRASGALELAANVLSPVLDQVGVPAQLLPLMLVRPISGSAALGVGAELIQTYGPDSQLGRTAAVMLGSTETTFYTIAVYFGAGLFFIKRRPPKGPQVSLPRWHWDRCVPCARRGSADPESGPEQWVPGPGQYGAGYSGPEPERRSAY